MNSINKVSNVRLTSPLLSGLLYAFTVMGGAALLVSFILMLTSQKEDALPTYAYLIHALAVLVGGIVSGKRSSSKGWYSGGMLGIMYTLIVFIVSFLGFDQGIHIQSLVLAVTAFIIGALGGIYGVNSAK
jgi:putative membrane protein (TIGR04086 family)